MSETASSLTISLCLFLSLSLSLYLSLRLSESLYPSVALTCLSTYLIFIPKSFLSLSNSLHLSLFPLQCVPLSFCRLSLSRSACLSCYVYIWSSSGSVRLSAYILILLSVTDCQEVRNGKECFIHRFREKCLPTSFRLSLLLLDFVSVCWCVYVYV